MWNEKKKALTFSFDDGVTQDKTLIEMLNRYGLKATFNLNSGFFGEKGELIRNGVSVRHDKIPKEEIFAIYAGHEIAVHTKTHPFLPNLPDEQVIREVTEDQKTLSELMGYEVIGMAYPCGGKNHDARVETLIRKHTACRYARTIDATGEFSLPIDPYAWNPTVYFIDTDLMFALGEKFLHEEPESPSLFYIWGHAYELDAWNFWDRFEEFCRMISGRDDIFYGTNREVLGI
ncbi:MAG: polysaccharide deacetylase family protein [Clostridia bacterium]|nr:polysaccharide deacetylase family protein [Clostridia bacterium]